MLPNLSRGRKDEPFPRCLGQKLFRSRLSIASGAVISTFGTQTVSMEASVTSLTKGTIGRGHNIGPMFYQHNGFLDLSRC